MLTFDTHATRYSNVTYRYNIHAIVYMTLTRSSHWFGECGVIAMVTG